MGFQKDKGWNEGRSIKKMASGLNSIRAEGGSRD